MIRLILTEIGRRQTGIIGWGFGIFITALLFPLMFTQVTEQFAQLNFQDIAVYQAFGVGNDFATLPGFLATYLSSMFIPLLAAYAIILGTSLLAGEEDDGSLEMLLTLPLPRWQIVLAKAIVLAVAIGVVSFAVGAGYALAAATINVESTLTGGDLLMAGLNLWPIMLVVGMFSLFLGAYLPSRRPCWIVATILLLVTYLLNNFSVVSPNLKDAAMFSPFRYYNNGLNEPIYAIENMTLFVIIGVCLLLAMLAFQRRDVTVGLWPWQRDQLPA
jgi:ABC-2 type transport system permease protein